MIVRTASRRAALAGIATIVLTATSVAFVESFDGLYRFAAGHGLSGFWAAVWPFQVDAFIIIGELTIFVGIVDRFDPKGKILAWLATLGGTLVSVTGNVLHVAPAHSGNFVWLATAGVPPVAATAGLMIGLQVLKRVIHVGGIKSVPVTIVYSSGVESFALRPLHWALRGGAQMPTDKIEAFPRPIPPVPTVKVVRADTAPAVALPAAPVDGRSAKYAKALRLLHESEGKMSGRALAEALGQQSRAIPTKVINDYKNGARP
jgi:hypothetical protein